MAVCKGSVQQRFAVQVGARIVQDLRLVQTGPGDWTLAAPTLLQRSHILCVSNVLMFLRLLGPIEVTPCRHRCHGVILPRGVLGLVPPPKGRIGEEGYARYTLPGYPESVLGCSHLIRFC